jgi:lysophospholipase L1-like esterase
MPRPSLSLLGCTLVGLLLSGCHAVRTTPELDRITGESLVFIGHEPSTLAYQPQTGSTLQVRSGYRATAETIVYAEGRDFAFDAARGTITRLPNSRLPDFRTNVLFGQTEFDHTKFPGYGNGRFFAYVDYVPATPAQWPEQPTQTHLLANALAKLKRGGPFTLVAFGDSITFGGEASAPDLIYWQRWVNDLAARYPQSQIHALNGATGGDNTTRGLERLQDKVISHQPDLVLIAFGMNDHNRRGVALPDFERQLRELVTRVRAATPADIVLLSTFPPNPNWKHSSQRMADYAAATARVAAETRCAYADVFGNWQALTARKRPEDLLANNINHPNDFGHWIYYRVLAALGL